jgi:PBP1b-binding outer membrane lipoprotein LpoB
MRAMRIGAFVLMAAVMLLAGCRREKAAQAKNVPAESSRTAAVDSTRKGIELIRRDGRGMELDR